MVIQTENYMKLGIMNGRLSPIIQGRIQAFPYNSWRREFPLAEKLGLQCIEWIFELPNMEKNPICTDSGVEELKELSDKHNIRLESLCADNFMEEKLFGENDDEVAFSLDRLRFLIDRCVVAEIPILDIPLMGKTSIKDATNRKALINNLNPILDYARSCNVLVAFELDLQPNIILEFINAINNSCVGVTYDIGNSTMLGFYPEDEIKVIGPYIVHVHIKDAIWGRLGATVPLGKGDADFETVFNALKKLDYKGSFILQSAREDMPDNPNPILNIDTIRAYMNFSKRYFNKCF